MRFKHTEHIDNGVTQYEFDIQVAGEIVPGVLWIPEGNAPRVLLAMGHGGSSHKKSENISKRAIHYAKNMGWASLAIDAPKHGGRISPEEADLERVKTLARIKGDPKATALSVEEKIKFLDNLAAQAIPEWQAALGAVLESGLIAAEPTLAYWGVSQGSSIGIPLLGADKRFTCAVLGLAQLHPEHSSLKLAAQKIHIPLRFVFQWDDAIRNRDYGLALFDAFASKEKSMHINPGGHTEVPELEIESWDNFFANYLL
ncbi:MAG: hypothetical protein KC422_25520 [Trueperaceae bacterium]|nr:hypothetical protein [Trueperaceae bacterium]